jgi:hypothetical protein
VIAYKFLRTGAIGPFSGIQWKRGEWIEAVRSREGWGIHACRLEDLSWWINAELWRVELEGRVYERATQIEADRGRLLNRIADWNEKARAAFGLACVFQTRDVSVSALRTLGHNQVAERLAAARTLPQLLEIASSTQAPPGFAGEMFGYAHDAAGAYTIRANPAEASFMASVATAAARGHPSGFDEERRRESRWIAEHLGLSAG